MRIRGQPTIRLSECHILVASPAESHKKAPEQSCEKLFPALAFTFEGPSTHRFVLPLEGSSRNQMLSYFSLPNAPCFGIWRTFRIT